MSRFTPLALLLAGAMTVGIGVGCKHHDKDHHKKEMDRTTRQGGTAKGKTLYERLGGEEAIAKVVHDFVQRAAADPEVNFTRKGHPNTWDPTPANVAKLEKRLVEFISMAAGGPQEYKGKPMVPAHLNMKITNEEFDLAAKHLADALDKFNVKDPEKGELLAAVEGTRKDIVGK